MMIRSTLLAAVAALSALLAAGPALAQASATQPASGTMTLFLPVTVSKLSDLSFGTVVRPPSGSGNVSVNAVSGQVTASGGAGVVSSGPLSASRASFSVTGEGSMNFTVSVPQTFNMTRSGGPESLQVTLNSTTGGGTLSGAYGSTGSAAFGIGGSLVLNSGTPSGTYSGSFTVTVAYN